MPAVNSSTFSYIEYDESSSTLTISFRSGNYDYPNFPKSLYEEFLAASSKGKFYNDHIKDKF